MSVGLISPESLDKMKKCGLFVSPKNVQSYIMRIDTREILLSNGYSAIWDVGTSFVNWRVKGSTTTTTAGLFALMSEADMLAEKKAVRESPLSDFPLIEELSKVPGMFQIGICPYTMAIQKAEAFSWDELVPGICESWETYKLKQTFKTTEKE